MPALSPGDFAQFEYDTYQPRVITNAQVIAVNRFFVSLRTESGDIVLLHTSHIRRISKYVPRQLADQQIGGA